MEIFTAASFNKIASCTRHMKDVSKLLPSLEAKLGAKVSGCDKGQVLAEGVSWLYK